MQGCTGSARSVQRGQVECEGVVATDGGKGGLDGEGMQAGG
jgi:hypothetical protein